MIPTPTPSMLRAVRESLQLSRPEFAARLNVTLRTLNGWEYEGRGPPSCLAIAILHAIDHAGELPVSRETALQIERSVLMKARINHA